MSQQTQRQSWERSRREVSHVRGPTLQSVDARLDEDKEEGGERGDKKETLGTKDIHGVQRARIQ